VTDREGEPAGSKVKNAAYWRRPFEIEAIHAQLG
jgi:hypothetical protein